MAVVHNAENKHLKKGVAISDMSAWLSCELPDEITRALRDLGFEKPTQIQALAIPPALKECKDILGAAETGSGKTLAFGIPVVSHILSRDELEATERHPRALVLTPTRELAIQIQKDLQAICKYTRIKVTAVIGGMALEKQKRLLKKCPEIIIATPGRLWELIQDRVDPLCELPNVRFLVIDEADRMVETNHFVELQEIMNFITGRSTGRRQSFVFSATLTFVHKAAKLGASQQRKKKALQNKKLRSLIKLTGMKQSPTVIDITKMTSLVDTLTETQISCCLKEKDAYLYYFVRRYPGRTLVFCNSISCVRRLRSLLGQLRCAPLCLHASMNQRQRLKNLEKFSSSKKAVLLATDVAARGLDIKGIQYVVHYQVPYTAEIYIHRSGRTARAQNEGLSLMLTAPQEIHNYKRIFIALKKESALPLFPVENGLLRYVKEKVAEAQAKERAEYRKKKVVLDKQWFANAAKEADIELENEFSRS